MYDKFSSFSEFTLYGYRTSHHVNNIFCNSHTKPRPLNTGFGGAGFPLKWFEDMIDKFLCHTDSIVFYRKDIITKALTERSFLHEMQADRTTGRGIFYGVAHQIYEYLIQLQGIYNNFFIGNIKGIDEQFQLLCLYLGLDDIDKAVHQFRNITFLIIDLYFSAFYSAHIQDVIDKAE